ncbi:MAG: hypothetical protein ACM3NQ_23305 [Bacteroidales bacterium]
MADITIVGRNGTSRAVRLDDYLDPAAVEHAEQAANEWIKRLRLARVNGTTLRDWPNYRGDSLWWFVELYFHKRRTIVSVYRAISALEAVIAREEPREITAGQSRVVRLLAPQSARRHGIAGKSQGRFADRLCTLRLRGRASFHTLSALADRMRPGTRLIDAGQVDVAAFVHSAFWRANEAEEGYIGPVLRALEGRLPRGRLALVGLGPRTNFRVRRWRHRFAEFNDPHAKALPFAPIELLAGPAAIRPSLAVWHARARTLAALTSSEDVRRAAVIEGYDAWPLVREDLLGVTHLQLPWSARCMDEAGAALDRLKPRVVVTYAEAGGWGRALVLESRRRHIPVVGLQHGFIYRHWLNYLHEADEMHPSPSGAAGFPYPDLTLLYDGFARQHLTDAGRFPADATAVTGSPRQEQFVEAARNLAPADRDRTRMVAGASAGQKLIVLAAKFSQLGAWFRALVETVASMTDVQLAVKCHPAETSAPYEEAAHGVSNVRVLGASTNLGVLVACADLIVTVNSTAALEAMSVDVPGLVLALPSNLSPFVTAGALAGVERPSDIPAVVRRLLYDQEARQLLAQGRRTFVDRYGMVSEGGAAARAADHILQLAGLDSTVGRT